jgi:hypothetical protein
MERIFKVNEAWNTIIGGGFVVGAIFWAGATYQRIGRIEKDLGKFVDQISKLAHLETMQAQIATHSEEIVMLRKTVYGDRWRQFGGTGRTTGDS